MEPLGLLCNLYGDGPSTKRKLQRAGCDSLAALVELDARELAARTGWDMVEAERFLREGWILAERLDLGLLEAEARGSHDGEAAVATAVAVPASEPPLHAVGDGHPPSRASLLDRWQELDRQDPPPAPEDLLVPRPPPGRRQGHPLEGVFLPGLGPEHLAALRERGLGTLEALVGAPAIGIARELGLGYTRVARWQFLAKKALEAARDPRSGGPREPDAPRVPRAPRDPDDGGPGATGARPGPARGEPAGPPRLDAAGPFA